MRCTANLDPPSPRRGFTLIELLVVIAIIAVLSVIGYVVFSGLSKGARDSRRKADIDAIAKAYEVGYSGGTYAQLNKTSFAGEAIPKDPDSSKGDYFNWRDSGGAGFKVCASLEDNPNEACNTPAVNCYCKFSSQGAIADGSHSSDSTTHGLGIGGSGSAPACDPNGTLTSGLAGWWKMDEASWNGNGSTQDVIDSSGNGNNGKSNNGANTVIRDPQQLNDPRAGNFNVNSAYVNIGDPANGVLDADMNNNIFSISFWMKALNAGQNYQFLIYKGGDSPQRAGYVFFINPLQQLVFGVSDGLNKTTIKGGDSYNSFVPVYTGVNVTGDSNSLGSWYHVVGIIDRTGALGVPNKTYAFINGVSKGSASISPLSSLGTIEPLRLGGHSSYYVRGQVDDVRVYNRALSQAEIAALYNSGNGCFPP